MTTLKIISPVLFLYILCITVIAQIDNPNDVHCDYPTKCSNITTFTGEVVYGQPMQFFELEITEFTNHIYLQATSQSLDGGYPGVSCFARPLAPPSMKRYWQGIDAIIMTPITEGWTLFGLTPSQGSSEWVGKWYFGVELYFGDTFIPGTGDVSFTSYRANFTLQLRTSECQNDDNSDFLYYPKGSECVPTYPIHTGTTREGTDLHTYYYYYFDVPNSNSTISYSVTLSLQMLQTAENNQIKPYALWGKLGFEGTSSFTQNALGNVWWQTTPIWEITLPSPSESGRYFVMVNSNDIPFSISYSTRKCITNEDQLSLINCEYPIRYSNWEETTEYHLYAGEWGYLQLPPFSTGVNSLIVNMTSTQGTPYMFLRNKYSSLPLSLPSHIGTNRTIISAGDCIFVEPITRPYQDFNCFVDNDILESWKSQSIPSYWKENQTIKIEIPIGGEWLVGVVADGEDATFSITPQLMTCHDQCSDHGNCLNTQSPYNSTCLCFTGNNQYYNYTYTGIGCQWTQDDLPLDTTIVRSIGKMSWRYFHIHLEDFDKIYQVSATSRDLCIFDAYYSPAEIPTSYFHLNATEKTSSFLFDVERISNFTDYYVGIYAGELCAGADVIVDVTLTFSREAEEDYSDSISWPYLTIFALIFIAVSIFLVISLVYSVKKGRDFHSAKVTPMDEENLLNNDIPEDEENL